MADQPWLKDAHAHIEADDAEMTAYRDRLAEHLPKRHSGWLRFGFPAGLALVASAATLWLIFQPQQMWSQNDIDQLQQMVADSSNLDRLRAQAQRVRAEGAGLAHWNAGLVLCMTLPTDEGVWIAAEALQDDPRPQFRAYYLEFLLDYADEYQFNAAKIEALMDDEVDTLCLHLFRHLLRIAEHDAAPTV